MLLFSLLKIDNHKVSSRICLLPNNHWINSMTLNNIIDSFLILMISIYSKQLLDEKTDVVYKFTSVSDFFK